MGSNSFLAHLLKEKIRKKIPISKVRSVGYLPQHVYSKSMFTEIMTKHYGQNNTSAGNNVTFSGCVEIQ